MFSAISTFFNDILVRPLLNLMVYGYEHIPGHNIGVVIIVLTLLVRVILAPSFHKSLRNQRDMSSMQPKMNAIRDKHKGDRDAQAKALMELYKEHNYNPITSCLPMLVQLPILLALYRVFEIGLGGQGLAKYLYHFVPDPGSISPIFFAHMNLAHTSWLLGLIAGVLQYLQSRMMFAGMQKSNDPTQNALQTQTMYLLPALTVIISLRVPAGLPLYWVTTTLFAMAQQYYVMKRYNKHGAVTVVK